MKRPLVVIGAKPLATGARAVPLGEDMIVGAEGIPPLIVNPPASILHPGAPKKVGTPNSGERQRLRIMRQRQRLAEKKGAPTPQGGA